MIEMNDPFFQMSHEEKLYSLLKKEHHFYEAILEVTLEEKEKLIRKSSVMELNILLKRKKDLLSSIEQIESHILPLRGYWHLHKEDDHPIALKIKEELGLLDHLIRQILENDQINQTILAKNIESLTSEDHGKITY